MSNGFRVQWWDRSLNPFLPPSDVTFSVLRYRTEAQGGHRSATIAAVGHEYGLWRLLDWLRYRVEIETETGEPVWWGVVAENLTHVGAVGVSVSLDGMANRIAVIWSGVGGAGGMTAWAEDAESVAAYGTKELLLSAAGVSAAAAETRRDWELAQHRYPTPALDRIGDLAHGVTLACAGDFDLADWTYYDRDEGKVEHAPGGAAQKLGWGDTNAHMAFSARKGLVHEYWNRLNALDRGEKFRLTGTADNNTTYTVEGGTTRLRQNYTAASIAFLAQRRRATREYIRASHNTARTLNNPNLLGLHLAATTLASGAAGAAEQITVTDVSKVTGQDRIRIRLDSDAWHETFISGTPNPDTSVVKLVTPLPSAAASGKAVEIVSRWVSDEGDSTLFVEGTDYTIGETDGRISVLSTGSIANNAVIYVSYLYTEYRLEDSDLGLGFIDANDYIQVGGSASNNGWYEVLSAGSEGDRVRLRHAVTDEAPGATVTLTRGSSVRVVEAVTEERNIVGNTLYAYGVKQAQRFTIPSDEAWTVAEVYVKVRKVGTPADSVRVALCSQSGGLPGTTLESATVPAESVSWATGWVRFAFANTTSLSPSTNYWLVVDRTGSLSVLDYYETVLDDDRGYGAGTFKVWDGVAWQDRPTDANLGFRVLGSEETTAQIAKIRTQELQFLAGADIQVSSGVSINQWRDGRTTTLTELVDLLEMGTSGNVRLLATVTRERYLQVTAEPARSDTPDYYLTAQGEIEDRLGRRLPRGSMAFVGKWVALKDALGPSANTTFIADPSVFFVEAAEYDAVSGRYQIETRGGASPWRAGMSIERG